ncbi:hypothetical protein BBM55_04535 [Vibrio parahaemolyticus]|nr:hypothetical protein BBM55_04535 [Vibrio parahaemolyticus]
MSAQAVGESCVDDLVRILKDPVYRNLEVCIFEHPGGDIALLNHLELELELKNALKSGKRINLIFHDKACSSAAAFYVYCRLLEKQKYANKLSVTTSAGGNGSFELVFHRPRLRISSKCLNGVSQGSLLTDCGDILVFRNDWKEPAVSYLKKNCRNIRSQLNKLARGRADKIFHGRLLCALACLRFNSSVPSNSQEMGYLSKGDVTLSI